MSRRKFIKGASAAAVAAGFGLLGRGAKAAPASDRVNIGVIGAGSRGQEVMRYFLRVPGVRVVGLCDVYEPRFAAARKITGEQTPAFNDYRRLLDARDLDAVLVATPLSFHAEHVAAALESGRNVYGEKALGLTIGHCDRIVEAVGRSGKLFQVGHQYRYAPWFQEAIRRVKAGEIGTVTHVYGYWHRNNNWRRAVPDPKFERLINWRMYREYSGGLMAELGSHQIDIANWVLDSMPESVTGSGGIDFYKDGRETYDNVQALFRYPGGRTFSFSSITTNARAGDQQWIYGTAGSVELTMEDAVFYYESRPRASAASGTVTERGVTTGATFSTKGDMPYRGPGSPIRPPEGEGGNPNFMACKAFVESLRQNKRPAADEHVGWAAAVSVCLANKAIDEGRRINFSEHAEGRKPAPGGGSEK
jgi:predicted dehydrogenase